MKPYTVSVKMSFPVTVKNIKASSAKEARKMAFETIKTFFKNEDAMYFDIGDGSYEPVDMGKEGLENISISVGKDYKVEVE